MELLSCICSRECKVETCTCIQNKLECTYMCKLATCSNQRVDDEEVYAGKDEDGEDEDDEH